MYGTTDGSMGLPWVSRTSPPANELPQNAATGRSNALARARLHSFEIRSTRTREKELSFKC